MELGGCTLLVRLSYTYVHTTSNTTTRRAAHFTLVSLVVFVFSLLDALLCWFWKKGEKHKVLSCNFDICTHLSVHHSLNCKAVFLSSFSLYSFLMSIEPVRK